MPHLNIKVSTLQGGVQAIKLTTGTDNLLRLGLNWDGLGGSCLSIREKDHHSTLLPGQSLKSSHLRCYGGVIAPVPWVTCTSVMAPLTPRGNYRPWNNIWCQHRDHILFRNVPRLKGPRWKKNLLPQQVLDYPACSLDLSRILKKHGSSWSTECNNRDNGQHWWTEVIYRARKGGEILLQKKEAVKALILNLQILPMKFVRFCHAIHCITPQLQPTWSKYFLQQMPF